MEYFNYFTEGPRICDVNLRQQQAQLLLQRLSFLSDVATSACFVNQVGTLLPIFSKRYLQGTEPVSGFYGTTGLPYGTIVEAQSVVAANDQVLRVALLRVTGNCCNRMAIHNIFNFTHQGHKTFIVCDLLAEEGFRNLPCCANAALPYTVKM